MDESSVPISRSESPWIISNPVPVPSIPSPAATHSSDESAKRNGSVPSWTGFIATTDEPGFLTFDEPTDNRSFSINSDMTFFGNSGLPTPALSPPQFRYLSPAALETRPASSQQALAVVAEPSTLVPPRYPASALRTPEPAAEDDETVCIRLLAHLKKYSHDDQHLTREAQLNLLGKSNAAVRRILRSKSVKSNYSCHLLLSSIMIHLVRLCEKACSRKVDEAKNMDSQFLQEQVPFDTVPGYFDAHVHQHQPPQDHETIQSLVKEAMLFTSTVGDMLKRKPLNGFQALGRHESLHVDLERRLKNALALLQ